MTALILTFEFVCELDLDTTLSDFVEGIVYRFSDPTGKTEIGYPVPNIDEYRIKESCFPREHTIEVDVLIGVDPCTFVSSIAKHIEEEADFDFDVSEELGSIGIWELRGIETIEV